MRSLGLGKYGLSGGVAVALLAGCGGSQLPVGAPGAVTQRQTPQMMSARNVQLNGAKWFLYVGLQNARSLDVYRLHGKKPIRTFSGTLGPVTIARDPWSDVYTTDNNFSGGAITAYSPGARSQLLQIGPYDGCRGLAFDAEVTATLVPHGICFPSYAFRFDTPGGSIVFSGDTALSPNLVALARGADVMVHEAVSFAYFKSEGITPTLMAHMKSSHTDIGDVAGVAKAAGVPTVILSHLGPGDPRSIYNAQWEALARAGAAKTGYRGTIVAPPDLARFDLHGRRIA